MAVSHLNFYENMDEANMRLNRTVVLYDGSPYYILCLTHHEDGIIRAYLDDMSNPAGMALGRIPSIPYDWHDEPGMTRAQRMDAFIEKHKDCGIIRKRLNSPKFDRFRPFPLGMCNVDGGVIYIERSPTRQTQQGLTSNMLHQRTLTLSDSPDKMRYVELTGDIIDTCIRGEYPSVDDCVINMNNPRCKNAAVAFDRKFAFVRGPVGTLFLAYKSDVVGFMPKGDLSQVTLSKEFSYVKESIEDLNVFKEVGDCCG